MGWRLGVDIRLYKVTYNGDFFKRIRVNSIIARHTNEAFFVELLAKSIVKGIIEKFDCDLVNVGVTYDWPYFLVKKYF